MGKYLIFDKETETHRSHKRKANPFNPKNYIVMRGWKKQGDPRCSMEYFKSKAEVTPMQIDDDVEVIVGHNIKFDLLYEMCISPEARDRLMAFFRRGGRVHCTQYAYYLINGQTQRSQMASMDSIIEEYGGRKKIDGIKELWEAGMLTSEIDPAMLEDYLIGTEEEGRNSGDIGNTELIYLGQLREMEELGMTQAVRCRMDGLCATTEMEFNGIKVDTDRARVDLAKLTKEFDAATKELEQYIPELPPELTFKWTSNIHVSCLLYGGTIKYQKQTTYLDEATGQLARKKATEKWPLFDGVPLSPKGWDEDYLCDHGIDIADIEGPMWQDESGLWCFERRGTHPDYTVFTQRQDTFKSGKRKGEGKTKNVDVPGELKVKYQDFFVELPGYTKPEPDWKLAMKDGAGNPIYGTGSDIIEILGKRDIAFLKLMSRHAALNKEIGTYYVRYDESKREYVGMLTCVDPDTKLIHHKLQHVNTVTSRLSSADPNLQNVPRGDKSTVKAMFVSRYPNGVMGELDYSQLEVVVQGLLTGDKNLIRDLNNKIDFHCKRVSLKYGCTYEEALVWCKQEDAIDHAIWKARRTGAKNFSFQRAYGAGASAIALSTGIPENDVKAMIEAEEKEYPGIVDFNNAVQREVEGTAEFFRDPERGFRTFRRGTWQSPTGTLYSWRSWDAPAFLKSKGITDTFSPPELKNYPVQGTGGEIVQMVLGYLWRWFVKTNNFDGKAVLINTVHDCVWADMHPDVVDVVIPGMKKIMEAVPALLKANFGIECPVPFPTDAETGANMLDLHHYQQAA